MINAKCTVPKSYVKAILSAREVRRYIVVPALYRLVILIAGFLIGLDKGSAKVDWFEKYVLINPRFLTSGNKLSSHWNQIWFISDSESNLQARG